MLIFFIFILIYWSVSVVANNVALNSRLLFTAPFSDKVKSNFVDSKERLLDNWYLGINRVLLTFSSCVLKWHEFYHYFTSQNIYTFRDSKVIWKYSRVGNVLIEPRMHSHSVLLLFPRSVSRIGFCHIQTTWQVW